MPSHDTGAVPQDLADLDSIQSEEQEPKSLARRIHAATPSMSEKQARLAHFFLENRPAASYATAREIGEMTSVSASTVVRFAQLLGYEGFKELQDSLRARIRTSTSFLEQLAHLAERPPSAPDELIRFVMMGYEQENLSASARSVDAATLSAAAKHLAEARRITLVGEGISSSIVEQLFFHLSRLGLSVARPNNEVDVVTALAHAGSGDVVLAVTFWRFLHSTYKWVRASKERGATTIAIVDNPWFPAAEHTDHLLVVSSRNSGQGPSVVGATALVNTLIAAIILTDFDRFFNAAETVDAAYGDADLLIE